MNKRSLFNLFLILSLVCLALSKGNSYKTSKTSKTSWKRSYTRSQGSPDKDCQSQKPSPSPAPAPDDTLKACWKRSFGRGVGKPISVCPANTEESGLLCYPPCRSGYTGDGPVCWEDCPSGFTNTGGDCLKPSSYGRGGGYALWHFDECQNDNPQGCERYGALYYPKCAANFHNEGCCVCSPDCPSGWTDIGVSCQKDSYGRGAGVPLICKSTEEEDAGLCYPPCQSGFYGVGPVCWESCPDGWTDCGAMCVGDADECTAKLLQIANDALDVIAQFFSSNNGDHEYYNYQTSDAISKLVHDLNIPMCS